MVKQGIRPFSLSHVNIDSGPIAEARVKHGTGIELECSPIEIWCWMLLLSENAHSQEDVTVVSINSVDEWKRQAVGGHVSEISFQFLLLKSSNFFAKLWHQPFVLFPGSNAIFYTVQLRRNTNAVCSLWEQLIWNGWTANIELNLMNSRSLIWAVGSKYAIKGHISLIKFDQVELTKKRPSCIDSKLKQSTFKYRHLEGSDGLVLDPERRHR